MHIADIFNQHKITFSFEFFPPKSDKGWSKLFQSIADLMPLNPAYVSVTYGAGGSTRGKTNDLISGKPSFILSISFSRNVISS